MHGEECPFKGSGMLLLTPTMMAVCTAASLQFRSNTGGAPAGDGAGSTALMSAVEGTGVISLIKEVPAAGSMRCFVFARGNASFKADNHVGHHCSNCQSLQNAVGAVKRTRIAMANAKRLSSFERHPCERKPQAMCKAQPADLTAATCEWRPLFAGCHPAAACCCPWVLPVPRCLPRWHPPSGSSPGPAEGTLLHSEAC